MESQLRAYLIAWLAADAVLSGSVNAIEEESPVKVSAPWIGIAASASTDWSVKDRTGREIRIALELMDRTDDPLETAATVLLIEQRIAAFMPADAPFELVSTTFLRSRAERRPRSQRAILLEYSFRAFEQAAA